MINPFRLISNLIFFSFLSFVLLFVFRDKITEHVVEYAVHNITGFSVDVEKLKIGVLRPVVDVKNLKVYNPKDYSDRVMMDMPELYVRYNLKELFKGKLNITDLRVNLKEFDLIKTEDGTTNVGELKGIAGTKETGRQEPGKSALYIERLKLRLGKMVYKDYSVKPPSVKTYNLNISKELYDITGADQVVRLIVVEAMLKSGLNNLGDVDVRSLEKLVVGTTSMAGGVAKGAVDTTAGVLKTTAGFIEGLLPFKKNQ